MIKIPLSHIKKGMEIIETDKKWLKLPFFNKPLADTNNIELLKNYGVKYVFINDIATTEDEDEIEKNKEIAKEKKQQKPHTDFDKADINNIHEFYKIHKELGKITKELFINSKTGKSLEMSKAKKIVNTYVENYFKKPDLLVSMTRLKNFDDYTFSHSINVCILSIALGKKIGLDAEELKVLGLGGLLHDIGKMEISPDIINKPGKLTDKEYKIIQQHPLLGYNMLKKLPNMGKKSLLVVLQHHENVDGSGYPFHFGEAKLSKYSQIVSIVNVYDVLTSETTYKKSISPSNALKKMLDLGGKHYNNLFLRFFIDILGIYPAGTILELNTNELAVVLEANRKELTKPKVLIIRDQEEKFIKPYFFELSSYNVTTSKPYKSIVAQVETDKYNIDPNKYIEDFISQIKK